MVEWTEYQLVVQKGLLKELRSVGTTGKSLEQLMEKPRVVWKDGWLGDW